jgi:hypothetical protein
MAPLTRSYSGMYGQINPGTPPPFDGTPQDSDDEMRDVEPEGQADVEPEHATNGTIFEETDASNHDLLNDLKEDRIVIAIDFGTTFSSVAYVIIPKGVSPDHVDLRHVRCIGNYPSYQPLPGVLDFRNDVPTELWYDDGSLDNPWKMTRQSLRVAMTMFGKTSSAHLRKTMGLELSEAPKMHISTLHQSHDTGVTRSNKGLTHRTSTATTHDLLPGSNSIWIQTRTPRSFALISE